MGGGFIFKMNNLANNQSEFKKNLLGLKKHGWIDRQTRAIFIEFITYNLNNNLFSKCLFLFEFISTGQIISSSQFAPVNIFDINNSSFISFNVIMFLIYMIFVTICMLKETKEIINFRLKYFKQFYNYIELLIILFSWTSLSMYLYRLYSSYEVYVLIKKSKKEFGQSEKIRSFIQTVSVNLHFICYAYELLKIFLGFCALFGTIKFVKLLRFNRKIIVFMQAFSHSVRDLANFGLIFAIVCISFVQAFYLIFNEKTGQFATLLTSIETLLQLILGKFDVLPIMKANAQLGFAFYALYNILVVLMLVNILVSILTDHYNEEKMGIEWNAEDHTLRKLCHLFDTIIQSHTPWLLFSQK
jgi:hypothetical protein